MWKLSSFMIFETLLKKNNHPHKVDLGILTRATRLGSHKQDPRHQWILWPMHILSPPTALRDKIGRSGQSWWPRWERLAQHVAGSLTVTVFLGYLSKRTHIQWSCFQFREPPREGTRCFSTIPQYLKGPVSFKFFLLKLEIIHVEGQITKIYVEPKTTCISQQ